MKASDWANLIWYSLLIITFLIAVGWIVYESRKHKGRSRERLKRAANWVTVVFSRIWSDTRKLFTSSRKRQAMELQQRRKAEEYRRKALLRYVCPICKHRLLSIPAVPPADKCEGTKYYCLNCGFERIEKDDE